MEDKNLIVPNIGEFKDVEVIEVLVNEGDFIKKNDPLIKVAKGLGIYIGELS